MRRYGISFAAIFVAAVFLTATVNYAIDSGNVYRGDEGRRVFAKSYVARLIASDAGLVFVAQERNVKAELAKQSAPDCVVWGSSREMQLSPSTAPGIFSSCKRFVNIAVSGGSLEDMIALLGTLPESFSGTIVIGIGPWLFRMRADERFEELRTAYERGRTWLGLPPDAALLDGNMSRLANLISADYFRSNLQVAIRSISAGNKPTTPTEIRDAREAEINESIFRSDGTLAYPKNVQAAPTPKIPRGVLGNYKIGPATTFDSETAKEFETLLDKLHSQSTNVILILTPYHPSVLDCRGVNVCKTFSTVETYIRSLGDRKRIDVVGSYDPRPFALTADDFIDGIHLKDLSLRKIGILSLNPWQTTSKTNILPAP